MLLILKHYISFMFSCTRVKSGLPSLSKLQHFRILQLQVINSKGETSESRREQANLPDVGLWWPFSMPITPLP